MRDSFFGLAGERFCLHGPAEGLGHGLVEVSELLDLDAQCFLAGESAAAKELSYQDGEPDLDLIEPRGVPGHEVEGDAMFRVAQECFTRPFASEHPRFAFDAEVDLEAAGAGNEADDGLGVRKKVPFLECRNDQVHIIRLL